MMISLYIPSLLWIVAILVLLSGIPAFIMHHLSEENYCKIDQYVTPISIIWGGFVGYFTAIFCLYEIFIQ